MTDKSLLKICELFYASHYFPLSCFAKDGNLLKCFTPYDNFKKVFELNAKHIVIDINPSIFVSCAGLYGIIKR